MEYTLNMIVYHKMEDVVYEKGIYWVLKVKKEYEIYKIGITHSSRVASIGEALGIDKCKEEIERRILLDRDFNKGYF